MKQPIVKVDGAYYNVSGMYWSGGNISHIIIPLEDGNVRTIFAPCLTETKWHTAGGKFHTVEFVEEVTA